MNGRWSVNRARAQSPVGRSSGIGLLVFVSCNGILGIGEPNDPPDTTGGSGGNAGSETGHGGESGGGSGGTGGSRAGGASATGGSATGGAAAGDGGEDAGGGGSSGEHAGNAGGGGEDTGSGGAGTGDGGVGGAGAGYAGAGNAGVGGAGAGIGGAGGVQAGSGGLGGAGAGSGGVGGTAGAPTADCDPDATFGSLVRLPINDQIQPIIFARLTDDELTMVFQGANNDIWIVDRASTSEDFSGARKLVETNTEGNMDWAPTLTDDGLTLFFERVTDRDTVFVATRKHRSDSFSGVSRVPSLDNTGGPYITPNGRTMYLGSENGIYGVFRTERQASSFVFGLRSEHQELSSLGNALVPVVSGDELTVYFASDRERGFGKADIYRARRSNRSDPFDEPSHVSELNSGDAENLTWISPDHCTIYMHRAVDGIDTLFTAKRASEPVG